jgi:copper chaperone CopZ
MARTTLRVAEIHCSSCERAITSGLERLRGVRAVAASSQTREIHIEFDPTRVTEAHVRRRLGELGFDPVDGDAAPSGTDR